jgi:HEAT repeat protein
MKAMTAMRDDRATPLFVYILRNVDHRGPLAAVYVRAIELLGSLKDSAGIPPLKEALYKGEWWRPGRTRTLRSAAAAALARIGTADAWTVLEEATSSRLRGVRAAARPHVAEWRRREARRESREEGRS